jgi:hypothetical protein
METGKYPTFWQNSKFLFLILSIHICFQYSQPKISRDHCSKYCISVLLICNCNTFMLFMPLVPGGRICNHLGCLLHNKIFLGQTNTHEVSASTDGSYLIADDDKYCFQSDVHKSVHYHTIKMNQPTRCNSSTSLLLDIYVWLNMFPASPCPSSGAYNCTRSLWFNRWREVAGAMLVVVWQTCQATSNNAPTATPQR